MSQLKRNVIAASLAAAGMFAVAAPSVAATSTPQEIKVKATVGSYMDWSRVDGVKWTEAMQLTFVNKKSAKHGGHEHGYFMPIELDTIVKPAKSGAAVRFMVKDALTLTDGKTTVKNFTISLGGVELDNTAKQVVAANESGVVGVGKKLKVSQDSAAINADLTNGKYVGFASIVMEGDA